MSAQTRYRTLVHNISRVYSSPDAGRTELLQAGIDEIVVVMAPSSAIGWRMVKSDTERLLRVWSAKEGDSDVARVVADQITGLLEELSTSAPVVDHISHVNPYPSLVVEEFTPFSRMPFTASSTERLLPSDLAPSTGRASDLAPLVTVTNVEEEESEVASVPADDESEQEEEEDSDDASAPASVVAPLVEEKAEEVVEEEEEVVEPEPEEEEEEEEEEAGMEVEQVMIRGRTYWKDTNTNKLYAVVRGEDGEDDVGDEVGVLENGKPRFLAK